MSARNTFAATRRSHQILEWLREGEGVTIQRVIDNFGIKYPQAREDLKLLEELYDLETYRKGRIKVWSWSGFDPDYVSVATAAALEFGGVAMDVFKDTPYVDEIERLTEHCRRRVGAKQHERLDRISRALHLRRTWLPVDQGKMTEHVEEILNAVFHDRGVAMQYRRSSDGEIGHYVVFPQRLVWYTDRLWLLAAHEETTKLFDIAGVQSLELASTEDDDGDIPELEVGDLESFFESAFGIYATNYPATDVHLEVANAWATYLTRYRVHPSQRNRNEGDTLHVHLTVGICPEFRSFVLGMLPDIKVHEPESLRRDIMESVSNWLDQ